MKKRTFKDFIAPLIFLLSVGLYGQDQEYFTQVDNPETFEASELAEMDSNFSIFAELLQMSAIDTQMEFAEPFTLIIPTDEAFGEMDKEEFNELKDPQNQAKLQDFVRRHIIPEKVNLYDFESDQVMDVADGKFVQIEADSDLELVYIGGAQVIASDIETSDGIIHVVDAVVNSTDQMRP